MAKPRKNRNWEFWLFGIITAFFAATIILSLFTFPISPQNSAETDIITPTFRWFGLSTSYKFLLDDNPDFTSPFEKTVTGNFYTMEQPLEFGTYYWKVLDGFAATQAMQFAVVPTVKLKRNETEVKNDGNSDIWLEKITGAFIVKINESIETGRNENVTARMV